MPLYRKKPVVIEAHQLPDLETDPSSELLDFLSTNKCNSESGRDGTLIIHTLEGDMTADPLDYIIKGVQDEFYPCKPDIFEKTYEKV